MSYTYYEKCNCGMLRLIFDSFIDAFPVVGMDPSPHLVFLRIKPQLIWEK
jgi:hypothetical protein